MSTAFAKILSFSVSECFMCLMKKMKEIDVINSIIYFFFVLQSKNYGGVAAYIKIL